MSDEQIRKILIEKKKKQIRYEEARAMLEGAVGFACLLITCFMLAVIG